MEHRREIDGLRALAVVPVILFHTGFNSFAGGFVGVDVFFVISGFLITSIILADKIAHRFSLANFYERRARRILPALFVVMLACLPFAWSWMLPDDLKEFSDSLMSVTVFGSNILFWRESGYFETAAELKPLLHTWSLAVEEQYYLLFPAFLALAWPLGQRRTLGLMAIVALLSLGLMQWGSVHQPTATFYLLPTRGWELLLGAFIAYLLRSVRGQAWRAGRWAQPLSLLGLLLIVGAIFGFDRSTPFPSAWALLPTLGAGLIIMFASGRTLAGRLLGLPWLVGIGVVSYSAYLWHQPILAFLKTILLDHDALWLRCTVVAAVFGLAWLSWKYIETPVRRHQFLKTRASLYTAVGACMALFFGVGALGNFTDGFRYKFEPATLARLAQVDDLQKQRETLIRTGLCHYNAEKNTAGIQVFLDHWNCTTDLSQPDLKRIPLIVTGDSHSADKVLSLKLNGYVPLQMGGAGCSLYPRQMTPDCRRLFDKLYQVAGQDPYFKYLALVNRFESDDELSLDAMRETIDYWQRYGKQLIFFTAMPDFNRYRASVANAVPLHANMHSARQSERVELLRYLASRGVHVVNTAQAFCVLAQDCGYQDAAGELLLTDPNHLSVTGARELGAALLRQDALLRRIVTEG